MRLVINPNDFPSHDKIIDQASEHGGSANNDECPHLPVEAAFLIKVENTECCGNEVDTRRHKGQNRTLGGQAGAVNSKRIPQDELRCIGDEKIGGSSSVSVF